MSESLSKLKAGVQVTVDALRSGAFKPPSKLNKQQITTTCRLPEDGIALMPGFPGLDAGDELFATRDTFLLTEHILAIHESIKANDLSPWTSTARRRNLIANSVLDDAILKRKSDAEPYIDYPNDVLDAFPHLAKRRPLRLTQLGKCMNKGALVHGIEGRGNSTALNFALFKLIARGTPVLIELAGHHVIYVPGRKGEVEVVPMAKRRNDLPGKIFDVIKNKNTVYDFDPQQLPRETVKGNYEPLADAACVIIPTAPNETAGEWRHFYATCAPLLRLHLYDLSKEEFYAVTSVVNPNITADQKAHYRRWQGTGLRDIASNDLNRNLDPVFRAAILAYKGE